MGKPGYWYPVIVGGFPIKNLYLQKYGEILRRLSDSDLIVLRNKILEILKWNEHIARFNTEAFCADWEAEINQDVYANSYALF